jgi:hypothetical protein
MVDYYGGMIKVWRFNQPQIFIASAHDAMKIMPHMKHHAKSKMYTDILATNGILVENGKYPDLT